MDNKISIRKAKGAKKGLEDLCSYIEYYIGSNINMIEIGSYVGDSTEIFAKYFQKVYSIDPYMNGYDDNDGTSNSDMGKAENQFLELCSKYKNIIKVKEKSIQAAKDFDNKSVDFIYIDGEHTYEAVKQDIKVWLPKVKDKGFIGGHDYDNPPFEDVKLAVDEFFNIDKTFKDTSWIYKKKPEALSNEY